MSGTAPHWLAAVADVLRADTGDLRELAMIAGADPATLYIGTSLDGADLRGQDLRGMILPNLGRRRVRHDRHTIFPDGSRGGRDLRRVRSLIKGEGRAVHG